MGFFDFNVPYLEGGGSEKSVTDKSSKKNARLKFVVKAMEMGYTGIAYNRSMSGIMSDADRCTISLFPLSSLLKAAPSFSASVKFQRELLGVPLNSPFRQYTRLTVAVDNPRQADALNSGNPVLKSYDLVAVRPLNQLAFERACNVSEVDIIAIDFSQKLPFRLKLPLVKAAMERGIYFEIVYSHLISDVQARRQLISNAKLLVDWTRGKNLIVSSAALTVNELRGPYDVANLSTLLGLSMERAKEAISKNCRALVANALKKKQWFKEAIKIERISPDKPLNSKEHWFVDCHNWDDISSGEGDLVVDEITKFFSASTVAPKTSKAIDFFPITNDMQLKNLVSGSGVELHTPTDKSAKLSSNVKEYGGSDVANENSKDSVVPFEVPHTTLTIMPSNHRVSGSEDRLDSSTNEKLEPFSDDMEIESLRDLSEVANVLGGSDVVPVAVGATSLSSSQECIVNHETVPGLSHEKVMHDATGGIEHSTAFYSESKVFPPKDCLASTEGDLISLIDVMEDSTGNRNRMYDEDSERPESVVLGEPDVATNENLSERDIEEQKGSVSVACDAPLPRDIADEEPCEECRNAVHLIGDAMQLVAPSCGMHRDVLRVADDQSHEEGLVELEKQKEECSIGTNHLTLDGLRRGKSRSQRVHHQAFPFPLKRMLKPVIFKKKYGKLKKR